MIAFIATLSLAAEACPEGVEGFAFAAMMSMLGGVHCTLNLASALALATIAWIVSAPRSGWLAWMSLAAAVRLGGAGAHDDLLGREVQAVLALEFFCNSFAQFWNAQNGRIARLAAVNGELGGMSNMLWSVKIRLSDGETNNFPALRL